MHTCSSRVNLLWRHEMNRWLAVFCAALHKTLPVKSRAFSLPVPVRCTSPSSSLRQGCARGVRLQPDGWRWKADGRLLKATAR